MFAIWKKALIIVLSSIAFIVGHRYFKTKDDSLLEELIEQQIKESSGIDIDLTPTSIEWADAMDTDSGEMSQASEWTKSRK